MKTVQNPFPVLPTSAVRAARSAAPRARWLSIAVAAASVCAGHLQAATLNPGDLVVTEVMTNPAAVGDSNGEWFEILNTSGATVDLAGLTLSDTGSNSHTLTDTLMLGAGDLLVLGRDADPATNGGYTPGYVYSSFTLGNSSDEIILTADGTVVFELAWSNNPDFGTAGNSVYLASLSGLIDENAYALTPQTAVFGAGDVGTPGSSELAAVSEVPLPAAGWLLLSALGALGAGARRRQEGCG